MNGKTILENAQAAAAAYGRLGFHLVPFTPGTKGPTGPQAKGWSRRENCIAPGEAFPSGYSIGLAHAYSGTMALDIDNMEQAEKWLTDRGISLEELLNSPDSVQILSGRENHGKLIYRMPPEFQGLPSFRVRQDNRDILNFRCGTRTHTTTQDVLPPSIHPDTGRPYEWRGDYQNIQQIPEPLLQVWRSNVETVEVNRNYSGVSTSAAEIESALGSIDPDIDRDLWVKMGMAIHSADPGLFWVFDEWSSAGTKYAGTHDTESVWGSYSDLGEQGVTVLSLFKLARESGWRGYLRPVEEVFRPIAVPVFQPIAQPATPEVDQVPEQSGPPPLFIRGTEGVERARTPPDWIIKGFMERRQVGVLYGSSQALKSYMCLDLAVHMVTGNDWHGFPMAHGHGKAWILAGEGNQILWRRQEALRLKRQIRTEDLHNLMISEHGVDLMSMDGMQQLQDFAASIGETPDLLIVDTLARNAILDENNARDVGAFVDHCVAISRAWDCTVLIVHHVGKGGDIRGSSAIHSNVDFMYRAERDLNTPGKIITSLKVEKLKGAPELEEPVVFQAHTVPLMGVTDFDGAQVSDLVLERIEVTNPGVKAKEAVRLGRKESFILSIAREMIATSSTLASTLGTSPGVPMDAIVQEAVDRELAGNPGDGKPRRYRVRNTTRTLENLISKGYFQLETGGAEIFIKA